MVKLLQRNNAEKKTVETDFILAHNLYAKAEVPPTETVNFNHSEVFNKTNIKQSCSYR